MEKPDATAKIMAHLPMKSPQVQNVVFRRNHKNHRKLSGIRYNHIKAYLNHLNRNNVQKIFGDFKNTGMF